MKQMSRNLLFLFLCVVPLAGHAADLGTWEYFAQRFITSDGRVVDVLQDGISHSEGQGYGMLLAVAYRDETTFNLLWHWTKEHLQVRRSDGLFAWSWGKRPTGELAPIDFNDASDGDAYIAWALLLAHERWPRQEYIEAAQQIIGSMRRSLLIEHYGHTTMLPGYYGFAEKQAFILNPSYWVLPAFRSFSRVDDQLLWERIFKESLVLVQTAAKDRCMVPDWIQLTSDGVSFHPSKPHISSYEAIRVILFLAWCDRLDTVPAITRLLDKVEQTGTVPRSIDLDKCKPSTEDGAAGFYAIMARAAAGLHRDNLSKKLWQKAKNKLEYEKDDYYSQVLFLLADMLVTP